MVTRLVGPQSGQTDPTGVGLAAQRATIAALGFNDNDMATHDTPKKLLARRRRANEAGRMFRHEVSMTAQEKSLLTAMAEQQGVTVPRLLVESALAPRGQTHAARDDALRRVFAMQRTLTGAATNINQLARLGNAQQSLPVGTAEALRDLRTVVARLDGLLDELAS